MSKGTIIYAPPPLHRHALPTSCDPNKTDLIGTIVRCDCGRYFRCKMFQAYGWADWKPVRWWNFRARKRIALVENGDN